MQCSKEKAIRYLLSFKRSFVISSQATTRGECRRTTIVDVVVVSVIDVASFGLVWLVFLFSFWVKAKYFYPPLKDLERRI